MAKAVARRKKRKAARAGNSSRSGSGERPKAPRTEAQIAASRASIEKARAARAANRDAAQDEGERQSAPHPADSPTRPKAFFTVGRREKASKGADAGDATAQPGKSDKPEPKALTQTEAESLRKKLIEMLVSLWELADKGLTATAFDETECWIWRSIDDSDTGFLADRILAKGRENPYVGAQVRALIDHWSDARMAVILGPRLLETAGWHAAHGLKVAVMGLDIQTPPKPKRQRAQSNGHYGQPGATTAYSTAQGATYGAQ